MPDYPSLRHNTDTIADAYAQLSAIVDTARNPYPGKRIQHNTYARRDPGTGDIIIRYHATDIIRYHADRQRVTLRANGWHTPTTALRFQYWLPVRWYVSNGRRTRAWSLFVPTGEMVTVGSGEHAWSYPGHAEGFDFWDGMTLTDVRGRVTLDNYTASPYFRMLPSRYGYGYVRMADIA